MPDAPLHGYSRFETMLLMTSTSSSARPWLRPVRPGQPEQLSDEDLIAAIVAGNDRVAAALYDRLAGVIDRSLFRVFGRREADHDDLVQSVFEQIVLTLARGSYAGNCSLKTWASRISSNVALNALRSRRRERKVVDRTADIPGETPSAGNSIPPASSAHVGSIDMERQSNARALLRVVMGELSEMNQRRAQAVILHDIEGYDLEEIAAITQVSIAAAQSRLVRGRKELLKRLDAHEKRSHLKRTLTPSELRETTREKASHSVAASALLPLGSDSVGMDDGNAVPPRPDPIAMSRRGWKISERDES
jgi:RNA polymerase sigma-70 factor (ECF subfamily)